LQGVTFKHAVIRSSSTKCSRKGSKLYALKTLKTRGLQDKALLGVTQATLCKSFSEGFMTSDDLLKLKAIIFKAGRYMAIPSRKFSLPWRITEW